MPPDETPPHRLEEAPPPRPLTPEEEAALVAINKLRKRIPKFAGVVPDGKGGWLARVKENGEWRTVMECESASQAWNAYRKARLVRRDRPESAARINQMLRISESLPVIFTEPSQSLFRSTMDLHSESWRDALNYADDYETTKRR
jgi:hypothetical protein